MIFESFEAQALIFVLFGFLKSFKPSEAFLTPFLVEVKGLTKTQVHQDVYPVWTYSYFALIIPMAFAAEIVGYKYLILFEALGHLATRAILLWAEGLPWMQSMQITFAIGIAGELVYYAYVFKVFKPEHQQKLQSWSRSAVLLGHSIASLLGQLLRDYAGVEYIFLFYISGVSISVAFLVSLAFRPDATLYEQPEEVEERARLITDTEKETPVSSRASLSLRLRQRLSSIFGILNVQNLGYFIVPLLIYGLNKTQLYNIEGFGSVLWLDILEKMGYTKDKGKVLNGYADAGSRFLGAVGTLLIWKFLDVFKSEDSLMKARQWTLVLCSTAITGLTVAFFYVKNIYLSYTLYCIIVGFSSTMSAVAATWLGHSVTSIGIQKKDFAIVFGLATLLCSGSQSLILIVVDTLKLDIVAKFGVFAVFSALVTIICVLANKQIRYVLHCFRPIIDIMVSVSR